MLRRAADDGDAEAWALLSLTYLGKPWIGENGNVGTDMAEAEHCLKKSLSEGSPVGLLAILARRGLYPTEELDFWDYWADEKETAVAEMEEYEARLLLAQVFMAQNPGKNSSRIESLLAETKYDKYFPGWLELAHYYKAHGRIYQYGQEMDALIKAGYEPAIKEKEDMYRGSEWSELF